MRDNFYIDKSDSIAEALLNNLKIPGKGPSELLLLPDQGRHRAYEYHAEVAVSRKDQRKLAWVKALGVPERIYVAQFLFESVIVGLLELQQQASFSGVLLGNAGCFAATHRFLWMPTLGMGGCWYFLFVFVGLIAGLYPAVKGSDWIPLLALRYDNH